MTLEILTVSIITGLFVGKLVADYGIKNDFSIGKQLLFVLWYMLFYLIGTLVVKFI